MNPADAKPCGDARPHDMHGWFGYWCAGADEHGLRPIELWAAAADEPLIDPDCRDGKCGSCMGGPCECTCHRAGRTAAVGPDGPQPVCPGGLVGPHDAHGYVTEQGFRWCPGQTPAGGPQMTVDPGLPAGTIVAGRDELLAEMTADAVDAGAYDPPTGEVPPADALAAMRRDAPRCPRTDAHGPHAWWLCLSTTAPEYRCPGIPAADPEVCGSRVQRFTDDRIAVCNDRPGHDGRHREMTSTGDVITTWPHRDALDATPPVRQVDAPNSSGSLTGSRDQIRDLFVGRLPIGYADVAMEIVDPMITERDRRRADAQVLGDLLRETRTKLERAQQAGRDAERERDLAIAHDRQPYPTAWAYDQACAALWRYRALAYRRWLAWQSARRRAAVAARVAAERDAAIERADWYGDQLAAAEYANRHGRAVLDRIRNLPARTSEGWVRDYVLKADVIAALNDQGDAVTDGGESDG